MWKQVFRRRKKAAKKWTLVWFLEGIDKIKSLWKFSFITDHILFKIASLVVVIIIGIYSVITNGNSLKILESDNYQIQYNTNLEEYYLLVAADKAKLNLYIPNEESKVTVMHLNKDNELLEEKKYNKDDSVVLESNTPEEDYYVIKTLSNEKESESLKVYIYREEFK